MKAIINSLGKVKEDVSRRPILALTGKFTMNSTKQSKLKLVKQYDLLAYKFNELYLAGKERGHDAIEVALEKTRKQMISLGEFTEEQSEDMKRYITRDIHQTKMYLVELGEESMANFHSSLVNSGALASLVSVLDATGNALHSLGNKMSANLAYHTGEMTSAGTLTCNSCGQTVHLSATGHIPPCPRCHTTKFSKNNNLNLS